eukprot:Hpha_TRINITY_DN11443_c0_g1::TRINITY_DN11443_c0_g1_i1::g.137330::m.137330
MGRSRSRDRDRRRDDRRDRSRDRNRDRDRRDKDRDRDRDRDDRRDRRDDRDRRDRSRDRSRRPRDRSRDRGRRDSRDRKRDRRGGSRDKRAGSRDSRDRKRGGRSESRDRKRSRDKRSGSRDKREKKERSKSAGRPEEGKEGKEGKEEEKPFKAVGQSGFINIPPPDRKIQGDWTCSECGANVFAFKFTCHLCGAAKPKPAPAEKIRCDICEKEMPRSNFSKVTGAEIDEMDLPVVEEEDDIPPFDPGQAYCAILNRRNVERGFGFAEHHQLKQKYSKDVLFQKTDLDKLLSELEKKMSKEAAEKKLIGCRMQFSVEQKQEGFHANNVTLYEVMCKDCMAKK